MTDVPYRSELWFSQFFLSRERHADAVRWAEEIMNAIVWRGHSCPRALPEFLTTNTLIPKSEARSFYSSMSVYCIFGVLP